MLADIPGLIEGAHTGAGLGHGFLRHIQRTRVLIHLLDGMAEDPLADFHQINTELALFDEALVKKPQIVALNKMDLPDVQERWPEIRDGLVALGARADGNLGGDASERARNTGGRSQRSTNCRKPEEPAEMPVYTLGEDPFAFEITRNRTAASASAGSGSARRRRDLLGLRSGRRALQRILDDGHHQPCATRASAGDTVHMATWNSSGATGRATWAAVRAVKRIGILGDVRPATYRHLILAELAADSLSLDRVLFARRRSTARARCARRRSIVSRWSSRPSPETRASPSPRRSRPARPAYSVEMVRLLRRYPSDADLPDRRGFAARPAGGPARTN